MADNNEPIVNLYDVTDASDIKKKVVDLGSPSVYFAMIDGDYYYCVEKYVPWKDIDIDDLRFPIYMAKSGNMKDTVSIAKNVKMVDISDDGKYILGIK